jgi:hypothetical protein
LKLPFYILSFFILLSSCGGKKLNKRMSLWRNDKIPYGTKLSYDNLNYIFPSSDIQVIDKSPGESTLFNNTKEDDEKSAFISIVPSFKPSALEWKSLMNYTASGNHVLISTFDIGQNLRDSLQFSTTLSSALYNGKDSLKVSLVNPVNFDTVSYAYPGAAYDNSFDTIAPSFTTVIGYNENKKPNFIRFELKSGGSIMIQLAPVTFTNFFLLHKENIGYYNQSLSYIPDDVKEIYWDDYFRYHEYGRKKGSTEGKNLFSKLKVFMQDDILRWAIILTAILFALIYLFDSKRKQRVIPPVKPLANASLDFVKTVGRLYFQQKNNRDLVEKLQVQFADHLRNRYNVQIGLAQDNFSRHLSYRTGYNEEAFRKIQQYFLMLKDDVPIADDDLFALHTELEKFYKHS